MDTVEYFATMKTIQENLLTFLENENSSEDDFQRFSNILNYKKIKEQYFEEFLTLLSRISSNHHRTTDFIGKIEKILIYIKDILIQKKLSFTLFRIFQENKRILLFLIKEKIIEINNHIHFEIKNRADFLDYFLPETISYFTKQEKKSEQSFEDNRKKGENHNLICKIIQNDSIEEFKSYTDSNESHNDTKIDHSIFETNNFLLAQKETTLIEYAAFFGSIKIFQYLLEKGATLNQSIWIYAIHGNNEKILDILRNKQIIPEDKTYFECFEESIKCYHINISKYIQNNFLQKQAYNDNSKLLDLFNFEFYPNNFDDENLFNCFCRNNLVNIVANMINESNVNLKVNEIFN